MVMKLSPVLSATLAIVQLNDPCAVPEPPRFDDQVTLAVPTPPDVVPLILIADAGVGLAGTCTASVNGAVLGVSAVCAAYNSRIALMSFSVRPVTGPTH